MAPDFDHRLGYCVYVFGVREELFWVLGCESYFGGYRRWIASWDGKTSFESNEHLGLMNFERFCTYQACIHVERWLFASVCFTQPPLSVVHLEVSINIVLRLESRAD